MRMVPRPRSARGVALMAMIWLITLLSFITVATVRVVSFDLDVSASSIHGFRAKQLAEMGIAVGANPVVERTDPLLSQFSEETGEGFRVELISEAAQFNINAILLREDKNLLKSMFIDWGLDIDQAGQVTDALIDWVDEDDMASLNGVEAEWYDAQGRMNQPFNRPFYDLDEMRLVRGMELVEAVKPDWRSWFTVWSGGQLDINEASAEKIAIAAEVAVETARTIPDTVLGPDGIRHTEDDVPFQSAEAALASIGVDGSLRPDILSRFGANETTTRIESTGITPGAKRKIILIVRNRTGQPAVLKRTEEVIP